MTYPVSIIINTTKRKYELGLFVVFLMALKLGLWAVIAVLKYTHLH